MSILLECIFSKIYYYKLNLIYKKEYEHWLLLFQLFQYNDTADKADITAYNINSTKWRVYDFTEFEWQDITTWSSNNLIVMKVKTSGEVMDAAFYNESLVLQVNT